MADDLRYFTEVLGGRVAFAIDSMGTRVADLGGAVSTLEARGWEGGPILEIPHGPCCSFETPGGHRLALYQLTRPEAAGHGRRDF